MVELEQLFIAEFESKANLSKAPQLLLNTFQIHTCQRTLILSTNPLSFIGARRHFSGVEAYEFLLRFACGLESEIKGETDVFGQIKTTFKDFSLQSPSTASEWHSIFTKLFEDTKDIRTQYLQGIGGNTYGALSRRLLMPTQHDPILIIGAGQISKSVAPYFAEFNLQIWNRSPERLEELKSELIKKNHFQVNYLSLESALKLAAQTASIIILATPAQAETDWFIYDVSKKNPEKKVLHLGGQAQDTLHFAGLRQFWSLSDLFLMEKEQSDTRKKQVEQAMHACHRRALLRSLSSSIHVAHGWEDLALFN